MAPYRAPPPTTTCMKNDGKSLLGIGRLDGSNEDVKHRSLHGKRKIIACERTRLIHPTQKLDPHMAFGADSPQMTWTRLVRDL